LQKRHGVSQWLRKLWLKLSLQVKFWMIRIEYMNCTLTTVTLCQLYLWSRERSIKFWHVGLFEQIEVNGIIPYEFEENQSKGNIIG
jgi:hypothetical protein